MKRRRSLLNATVDSSPILRRRGGLLECHLHATTAGHSTGLTLRPSNAITSLPEELSTLAMLPYRRSRTTRQSEP